MTYDGFVRQLAWRSKAEIVQTKEWLKRFFLLVEQEVAQEGRLVIPGFGVFKLRHRKARRILSPPGGERLKMLRLPETLTIGFSTANRLKKRLNDGRRRRSVGPGR